MAVPQILQQLGAQGNPNLAQLKNMMNMVKNAKDPQALLRQMLAQNNPHIKRAMDYVQANGGDPKAAFEKLAAERGIDPAEIENMLR